MGGSVDKVGSTSSRAPTFPLFLVKEAQIEVPERILWTVECGLFGGTTDVAWSQR